MYAHPLLLEAMPARPVPALLKATSSARSAIHKVLIPVDGSAIAEAAFEHVIALARFMPLTVHLLNVQSPVMAGDVTMFSTAGMVEERRRAAGERVLKRASGVLNARRIDCHSSVTFGAPADEIARYAARTGCSKIIMATRHGGFLRALLRRSVAHRVVKLAHVPVTLVKARPPERGNWAAHAVTQMP